jgi:hypothetical protein
MSRAGTKACSKLSISLLPVALADAVLFGSAATEGNDASCQIDSERSTPTCINMQKKGKEGEGVQIPTKSPVYSDLNSPAIPISIRPPFRDIPAQVRHLADDWI